MFGAHSALADVRRPLCLRSGPIACPTNANAKPPAYTTRKASRLLRKPSSWPSTPSRQVPNGQAPRNELRAES